MDEDKMLQKIVGVLREWNDIVIVTHQRADGDAVGSMLALAIVLTKLNKRCVPLLNESTIDPRYAFLPGCNLLIGYDPAVHNHQYPYAVILDAPTLNRLDRLQTLVPPFANRIVIDHHPSRSPLGQYSLVNDKASSTCELLIPLIHLLGLTITADVATCLFTGITFDTGGFRFSNATAAAFCAAAELVSNGANPELISYHVFNQKTASATKLLGAVLNSVKLFYHNQIALLTLSFATFQENNGDWTDLEGFVDHGIAIGGVRIAIFVKEIEPLSYKISLRSREDLNVQAVAERFGGGGHFQAAGFSYHGQIADLLPELLESLTILLR